MVKKLIHKIKSFLTSGNQRTTMVKMNSVGSLLIKIVSMGIDFVKVPLLLSFLSAEKYGLYITIASIVYWTHNFDFGLGAGLRYKLTAAISNVNYNEGKILVSTSYLSLSIIMAIVLIITLPIIGFLDWHRLLNAPNIPNSELIICISVVLIVFAMQFVLELISNVLQAYQRSAFSSLFKPLANAITLMVILIVKLFCQDSLLIACLSMTIPIVIVLFIANLLLYKGLCQKVSPNLKFYKNNYLKDIYSLGLKFFISQISNLVVFQSAAFLLSYYINPIEAATYNTAYTYFGAIVVFNTTMMLPLSAAVTDAYIKDDYDWIKRIMRRIYKISFLLSLLSLMILAFSSVAFKLWIGERLIIPWRLRILMTIYFIFNIWTTPYSSFIAGVGKMSIAMLLNIVKIIIYIPVAVVLVKVLGTSGIMLSIIIINTLPNNFFYRLQYLKIVNKTATGIWNQ